MEKPEDLTYDPEGSGKKQLDDFQHLTRELVGIIRQGRSESEFMPGVLRLLLNYSGSDEISLLLAPGEGSTSWTARWRNLRFFYCEAIAASKAAKIWGGTEGVHSPESLKEIVSTCNAGLVSSCFTDKGSFYTGDANALCESMPDLRLICGELFPASGIKPGSIALVPLAAGEKEAGTLRFVAHEKNFYSRPEVEFYESLSQVLGVLFASTRTQAALSERLKELTCLYGISKVLEQKGLLHDQALKQIADLLPPAMQYPEIASARISLDGLIFSTSGFSFAKDVLPADIIVGGERRGLVEIAYTEIKPVLAEGPFLKEERSLIDAVAREITFFLDRKKAEDDKVSIQNHLRQADRLATVGQIAASIAHDLNEPLSNILGFAQLAEKANNLPGQADKDIRKIIEASLYARGIVKKLLGFTRQVPITKVRLDLNKVIDDSLFLFEKRCMTEGIELVKELASALPEVEADQVQANQILVNLMVNAIQAMPDGGKLTIRTGCHPEHVFLSVEDTGIGMDDETLKHIFNPFFTTKEKGEGTGLGLPMVQDIVKSHGGTIKVDSKPGQGSRFEVRLPIFHPQAASNP